MLLIRVALAIENVMATLITTNDYIVLIDRDNNSSRILIDVFTHLHNNTARIVITSNYNGFDYKSL